jgi:oxygen-independent coproporphyrinogen-3 oxidase
MRERGDAIVLREEPAPRQLAGEAAMLALRTAAGLDEAAYAAAHGAPWQELFPEAASLAAERGWLERDAGRLRLTPEGMLFSDALFRLLF